ncbi:hypothetical protein C8R45DRAFT_1005452 [Mycena sanguinolenta]|nr:hypothetical protein C8R45DRAFT_1005452 [Mycena sanguinolenta]
MPCTSLVDLPTELLMITFEHPAFPSEALFHLAGLSRRLHFIALPVYFSRQGIDLTTKSVTITFARSGLDPLSALRICLFLPSELDSLICNFPQEDHRLSIYLLLGQMRRLSTFLSRLTSVKVVKLDLCYRQDGGCLATGSPKVLDAWASGYGNLLRCVVETGCISLTVRNGRYFTDAFELYSPGPPYKYLPSTVQRLLAPRGSQQLGFKQAWGYSPDFVNVSLSVSSFHRSPSLLTFLDINSATLLMPPALNWTLTALRQSPITSLTICMSRHMGLKSRVWATVLPLVAAAASNLEAVCLTELDTAADEREAFAFLARLPELTRLDLTHASQFAEHHTQGIRNRPPRLKHLVNLRASITVVEDFLLREGSLPAIHTICMVWQPPLQADVIDFAQRVSTITARLASLRLSPRLSLCIESRNILNTALTMAQNLNETQCTCFGSVKALQVKGLYYPGHNGENSRIAQMVARFPRVDHVSLATYRTFPALGILDLVRCIQPTELLKKVEVDGESYHLSSGLLLEGHRVL